MHMFKCGLVLAEEMHDYRELKVWHGDMHVKE